MWPSNDVFLHIHTMDNDANSFGLFHDSDRFLCYKILINQKANYNNKEKAKYIMELQRQCPDRSIRIKQCHGIRGLSFPSPDSPHNSHALGMTIMVVSILIRPYKLFFWFVFK